MFKRGLAKPDDDVLYIIWYVVRAPKRIYGCRKSYASSALLFLFINESSICQNTVGTRDVVIHILIGL